MTEGVRTQLLITWAAVLLVLAIGCVNIAGLLMSRSAGRQREIATRMALGASRASIVRQLLVESLLLAVGGCVAGIGVGAFALAGLKRLGAESFHSSFEIWRPIELDVRVVLAMFGLAQMLQTSGFMAVYLAGIVIGATEYRGRQEVANFYEGFAWLAHASWRRARSGPEQSGTPGAS